MDVTDALRRIVMRHLVLIALCTLIPVIAFAGYKSTQKPTYTASVRMTVGDKAASSTQNAVAVADNGITHATSVDTISAALTEAGVKADPGAYAANVTAAEFLTSTDITIKVVDTSAQQAVNVAKAIADQVTKQIHDQNTGSLLTTIKGLQDQLAPLQKQRSDDQQTINRNPALPNAVAVNDLNQVGQAINTINTQILKDQSDLNNAFTPSITDAATIVPATTLTKVQPYVLVFALGLILGIGISAVLESASPSVVGAAGLSGLFGAPALGFAVGRNGKIKGRITDLALAARLHAAARRVGADTVVIAGDVRCDIPDLAQRLDSLLGGATNQQIHGTVQQGGVHMGPGAPDPKMLNAGETSKDLVARPGNAPAMFSESLSFGEDIPSVWVHPRVVPYDEQVLLLLSTAPVSVAVAVVGAPKGKRKNLLPAIELVETSGWEILGTILADASRKDSGL